MLSFPHILVGATIATAIPDPVISLPLALASHMLGDYFPHWNPHIHTEKKKYGHVTKQSLAIIITDSTLALFVGSVIAFRSPVPWVVFAACFLSVLL